MAAKSNKPCPKCGSVIYRVVVVSGCPRLECGCGIIFNPFANNEFELMRKWNERPEIKEEKITSNNIDYAAALREIEELMVLGRFTMRKKLQYIDGVISRLNSQKKDCELRII